MTEYSDEDENGMFDWSDTIRRVGYANEEFERTNKTEARGDVAISFLRDALDLMEFAGHDAVSVRVIEGSLGVVVESLDEEDSIAVAGRIDGPRQEEIDAREIVYASPMSPSLRQIVADGGDEEVEEGPL